jgi:hypothetical protein
MSGRLLYVYARKKPPPGVSGGRFWWCLCGYDFKPLSGLVDAVNMLSSDVKFITIENFAMKATADTIADKFAASDSAKATQSAGSGRRRRGRAAAATGAFASDMDKKAQEPAAAHRLVVDPESDAPISVTMTLKVTDFGRPVRSVAAQAQQPAANDAAKAAQPEKEDK